MLFLSASLLAGMNVPILLMGVILPFYAVVDAIEPLSMCGPTAVLPPWLIMT